MRQRRSYWLGHMVQIKKKRKHSRVLHWTPMKIHDEEGIKKNSEEPYKKNI